MGSALLEKLICSFAAASSRDLAERMIQQQVVSALLNTIANVGHVDSQRYATNLLLVSSSLFKYSDTYSTLHITLNMLC